MEIDLNVVDDDDDRKTVSISNIYQIMVLNFYFFLSIKLDWGNDNVFVHNLHT